MKKSFFGININIILLGIISFLNDLSSEMILPIFPLFIKSLGGTGIIIGIIGGVRDGISNILKIISGYFSDISNNRKTFIFSGYFSSTIFKFFLAFSKTLHQVLFFSSLERTGKGLRDAPRDAILAHYAQSKKGKIFGFHQTLDTAGAILGSITVLILFWILNLNFKTIIIIASCISLFSLLPLYFVEEPKNVALQTKKHLTINIFNIPAQLKYFLFIASVFSLANFSYMFFILRAQEKFMGKLAIGAPILLYIFFNTFYAIFAIPFGIFYDKIGRRIVIGLGYFIFSLTSFGFIFAESIAFFIILFILYGITKAITESTQRAYVADISPENLKGTMLGTFYAITGSSTLLSSICAGILWQRINSSATFVFGGILSLFATFLVFALQNQIKQKQDNN